MTTGEAIELIRGAVTSRGGSWADLGAGDGTWTRALLERLGTESRIYAVDRDPRAIAALERWASAEATNVIAVQADFSQPFRLPGLANGALDGMLLANSLHFVRDPEKLLAQLTERLRPGGRVVLIEYDRRAANPWVPFPIPRRRLPALAAAAGLSTPVVTATRPSDYGGEIYVAIADRTLSTKPSTRC